jgi:hypothetical protein
MKQETCMQSLAFVVNELSYRACAGGWQHLCEQVRAQGLGRATPVWRGDVVILDL